MGKIKGMIGKYQMIFMILPMAMKNQRMKETAQET